MWIISTYVNTNISPSKYMSTYIHTYIHTYMHAYIHACMHAYMQICIHAYMHTCMHAWMHLHTGKHVDTHTCVFDALRNLSPKYCNLPCKACAPVCLYVRMWGWTCAWGAEEVSGRVRQALARPEDKKARLFADGTPKRFAHSSLSCKQFFRCKALD